MPEALVETKLLLPRVRSRTVDRSRLEDLLARGADARLLLVSAPAGFGKTTLLAQWCASAGDARATAWVSLDEVDREAPRFWGYVLRAVDRAVPGAAAAALAELESGDSTAETVLTALLNELSVLPGDLAVVLDDYHLADGPDVRPGMTFLLDHLPPQVRLVISTRADPALPLARLRAHGELVEIRAADLRFTADEAAGYLNDLHTLGLTTKEVSTLEGRTEGWAAALQLAALSLRGRDDRAAFIDGFAGDDRFVVDYLADEVLDRVPPDVRAFLRDTSVLDRLTGPLCDAVTGSVSGQDMLASLDRQNLFVTALDPQRRWYRYHHLFADVLRARLLDEDPARVPVLHRRASEWYAGAHDPEEAVRHALAAGDTGLAAAQVELAVPELLRDRREAVIRRWVDELPAEVVRNRPVLAIGLIAGLAQSNEFAGLDRRLDELERLLASPTATQVVVDERQRARLPATVPTYRAALALVAGDLADTVEHARLALARAADDDHLTHGAASALIGLASWPAGELDAAHEAYRAAAGSLRDAGHVADVLGCSITLADIEITQGRLGEAERTYRHALELTARDGSPLRGAADMHVGLSRVALERGDLSGAAEHLRRASELGDSGGLPQNPYRWRVALALLRQAEGDPATAVSLLEEADRVYVGDFSPPVRPVAAVRARVLAASGRASEALAWARAASVATDDELAYLREYEHVTLAHALLADHAVPGSTTSLTEAQELVDRLLAAAEAGGRTGVVIEVLVLQALTRSAAGEQEPALASLERALRLAEPEGYVRVFTGEGPAMRTMLRALGSRHRGWAYVGRLLAGMTPSDADASGRGGSRPAGEEAAAQELVDPLSERELDVLRYLRSELDGPSIARELGVSLSTVRTHTQHIYAKLGVGNRRAAVRRAHQLNLFSTATRG